MFFDHRRTLVGAIRATLVLAILLLLVPAARGSTQTTTVTTPGEYQYTVPAKTISLQVMAIGAAGATTSSGGAPPGVPGQGAQVFATLPVPAGTKLYVEVGSVGGGGHSDYAAAGGGESAIQTCSSLASGCTYTADPATDPRLVVAGGGGGGGEYSFVTGNGGGGGNADASQSIGPGAGGPGTDSGNGVAGGVGGLTSSSSTASAGTNSTACGSGAGGTGGPGTGGSGADANAGNSSNGGGGGAGWIGGSGGGAGACPPSSAGGGGGGGGGASFVEASGTINFLGTTASSAEVSITATIADPPFITSANTTTFVVGTAGTFEVTTTGFPSPSLAENGTLPSGVTFSDNGNGTATLSGTATTGGIFHFTITASNGASPNGTQSFTLTVDEAPAITSANATTFVVGQAGSFTVATSGYPVPALSESGTLPSGATFIDNGNGTATLSGTPATGGTFPLTITAANGISPNATQTFSLTVDQAATTTTLSSSCMTTFVENQPFTITADVTGASPSGSATFTSQGSTVLCSNVSLSSGSASCTASMLATSGQDTQDTYSLTASYGGDTNNMSSASSPLYVTVLSAGDVIFRNGYEAESASCPIE